MRVRLRAREFRVMGHESGGILSGVSNGLRNMWVWVRGESNVREFRLMGWLDE